jgi:branched-chain amino acid transport system permease protein
MGLATIAFDLVVVVLALNGGTLTGGPLGLFGIPVRVTVPQLVGVVAVVGYLLTRLETGRTGRYFDALRNDEPLAAALGIRVNRWRVFAFTLSAAIAALSGSMHVLLFNAISPEQFGFSLIILVLSMVVVGGAASWVGALIGAALIEFLPEFLSTFDKWRDVAYGVLLILVVGYAPDGILGLVQQGFRRLVGRTGKPSSTALPAGPPAASVGATPVAGQTEALP